MIKIEQIGSSFVLIGLASPCDALSVSSYLINKIKKPKLGQKVLTIQLTHTGLRILYSRFK